MRAESSFNMRSPSSFCKGLVLGAPNFSSPAAWASCDELLGPLMMPFSGQALIRHDAILLHWMFFCWECGCLVQVLPIGKYDMMIDGGS